MYDESKYIDIDVFKDKALYRTLAQYNSIIEQIARSVSYQKGGFYDVNKNEASFWFNPDQVRLTPLPSMYPNIHPIQYDNRFWLVTHCVNHEVILIIDTLFSDRKNILIEDICCGMGNQIFYLSLLGFKNFSAIDNFSQLPKSLFEKLMNENLAIKYELNNMNSDPVVSSLIAYIKYVKRDQQDVEVFNDSLELFLSYVPLIPGSKHLSIDNTKFFERFTPLSRDKYRMLWGYCRNDKYKEFAEKLQEIKI